MNIEQHTAPCGTYYKFKTDYSKEFNESLLKGFLTERDKKQTKKTHYFEGRYENIYIDRAQLPELEQVLSTAEKAAEEILSINAIKAGGWFNEMPPGHRTIAHRHDDDDELLSGVYYVTVPESSGNLILGGGAASSEVQPMEGMMVFFPPDLVHEVENNESPEMRLSIGMNFGKS